jgi:hypothetical protein
VRSNAGSTLGFASDVLSDFDATADELRVTLARASRYACDPTYAPTEKMWEPVVDCGELKFSFALFGGDANPDHITDMLLSAPTAVIAPAQKGPWAREGSLGEIMPASVNLLTFEELDTERVSVRVQNRDSRPADVTLHLGEAVLSLGLLEPLQIQTFVLERDAISGWRKPFDKSFDRARPHLAISISIKA